MDDRADVLVIGSGVAGLTAALHASQRNSVIVLAKAALEETNTAQAQGGIAAVVAEDDRFEWHSADTLEAGGGICDRAIVDMVVQAAPQAIDFLEQAGVGFETRHDSQGRQEFDLGQEGGHSRRRILHSMDMTGRRIEDVLLEAVNNNPSIRLFDNALAVDLITLGRKGDDPLSDRCLGAYVLDKRTGKIITISAGATIIATGGSGKVYLYTSNPDVATGDGVAMAWRAGASVSNMEFFQFHPTCLYHPAAKSFLVTEAVRGEGALLLTRDGRRFMPDYHSRAELAPRDVVARAIDSELKRTGDDHVLLDITHRSPDFIEHRFPRVFGRCLQLGIDMRTQPIPVVPAAHYQCGGVKVDEHGWTGIPGLYVVGEAACTGMHGANRLASNSLLEAVVFGRRAALDALKWLTRVDVKEQELPRWNTGLARSTEEAVVISQNWDEIRRLMWNFVGVVRSDNRLLRARKRLSLIREEVHADYWSFILTPDLVELRNLSDVAHLILEMAIMRKESRGLHYNIDYPDPDDANWKRESVLRKSVRRRP